MKQKSWHLNRRTFLKTSGICVALPWLEAMGSDKTSTTETKFFGGFFHHGVPMPESDAEKLKFGWFPIGTGKGYKAPAMHKSIMSNRQNITFLSGLSHPKMNKRSGHDTGDSFLTGSAIAKETQHQSLDQYIADKIGNNTRYKSLVLSSVAGVGVPTRSTTLSYDKDGRPIPALANPQRIFHRLFGKISDSERRALGNRMSILDKLRQESRDLNRRLGKNDKEKMDEYLNSIREVEKLTQSSIKWQEIPKPKVDIEIKPDACKHDNAGYFPLMYKLIALALQTDSTNVVSFMAAPEIGDTGRLTSGAGISKNSHGISHSKDTWPDQVKYLTYLNNAFAGFISDLASKQYGDSTLLDKTLLFYGCGTSKTHVAVNYPLIIAGGKDYGFKHGQHHNFSKDIPLCNLFVTMTNQLGIQTHSFSDSNGNLNKILS